MFESGGVRQGCLLVSKASQWTLRAAHRVLSELGIAGQDEADGLVKSALQVTAPPPRSLDPLLLPSRNTVTIPIYRVFYSIRV